MTRPALSLVLLSFLLAMNLAHAKSSATAALEQLLKADFTVDSVSRQGRVAYSDGKTTVGDGEESMPRATWDPLDDTLAVTVDIGVPTCQEAALNTTNCDVSFRVLAETNGLTGMDNFGLPARRLVVLNTPKQVVVHYRLVRQAEVWLVLDPPKPFVSGQALVQKLSAEAHHTEETLRVAKPVSSAWKDDRKRWMSYFLEEAEKLRHMREPESEVRP